MAALLLTAWAAPAQNLTNEQLLHPPADTWPTYHGDYSGRRHSPLKQITPDNVNELSLGVCRA